MTRKTIVIVGGGYAGMQALIALRRQFPDPEGVKIVLIDKHPGHLKKVLLFKAAVGPTKVVASFAAGLREMAGVEFVQAEVMGIEAEAKAVLLRDREDRTTRFPYDALIVAVGSQFIVAPPESGGINLASPAHAEEIKRHLAHNIERAISTSDPDRQDQLLRVAVVGGGISGVETAAEIATWLADEKKRHRLDAKRGGVHLINAQERLLPGAPKAIGRKLEQRLGRLGVTVRHGARAERFEDGQVRLKGGSSLRAQTCVWTLGLRPSPALKAWKAPTDEGDRMIVDAHYRVSGWPYVYAIGDCARIVDPATGRADGMTCREATAQACRLAAIVQGDFLGQPVPAHGPAISLFCIGLGPSDGFIWTRKWGLDIVLTGKLGWKIRDYTWQLVDFFDGPRASRKGKAI
ncbi:MAG TPA: FAD-dependent oxidoreductase [Pantanalinema sp.]